MNAEKKGPMEQESDSAWSSGKTALIATVIALAFNPISIVIGYVLNERLSAPELSIEYVDIRPEKELFKLDEPTLARVIRNPVLKMLLREGVGYDCQNWLRSASVSDECLPIARNAVEGLLDQIDFEIEGHQANIETIRAWDPAQGDELILRPTLIEEFGRVYGAARRNPQYALDLEKGAIGMLQTERRAVEQVAELLKAAQASQTERRTGTATIVVGILNSGNTDGAVLGRGELRFGGSSLAVGLPAFNALFPGSHPAVEAHTLKRISLVVDENKSSKEALEKWKNYLTRHLQDPLEIRIETTGGTLSSSAVVPP